MGDFCFSDVVPMDNDKLMNCVFDAIQDGILVISVDLTIIQANKTVLNWCGNKKIIGKKCYEVFHLSNEPCSNCPALHAIETGDPKESEITSCLEEQITESLELFAYPIKNNNNEVVAIVEYIRNITESKRVEETKQNLINKLSEALTELKELRGIIPICSYCKRIRHDHGYWENVDSYLHNHSESGVTHGICPECLKDNFPEHYEKVINRVY